MDDTLKTPKRGNVETPKPEKVETSKRGKVAKSKPARKCHGVTPAKKAVATAIWACVTMWHSTGCGMTNTVNGMIDPVSKMVQVGADKVDKQGMLDKWLARARANGHDPSVELFTRIEVVHGARLGGVNVQLEGEAGGDSTRLPDDFVLGLYAVYNDPRTSPEERARIEAVLLWNRTAAGGNVNAPRPSNAGSQPPGGP